MQQSSDYKDAMNNSFPNDNVSVSSALLDFHIGFAFNVYPRVHVSPRVHWLVGQVKVESPYQGFPSKTKYNSIIMPEISTRYSLNNFPPSLYGCFNLGFPIPSSTFSSITADSDGLAYGVGIGYAFDRNLEIELGYNHIPVKYYSTEAPSYSNTTYNFGGINLGIRFRFGKN